MVAISTRSMQYLSGADRAVQTGQAFLSVKRHNPKEVLTKQKQNHLINHGIRFLYARHIFIQLF